MKENALVIVLLLLVVTPISFVITYQIIKAAIKNGINESKIISKCVECGNELEEESDNEFEEMTSENHGFQDEDSFYDKDN